MRMRPRIRSSGPGTCPAASCPNEILQGGGAHCPGGRRIRDPSRRPAGHGPLAKATCWCCPAEAARCRRRRGVGGAGKGNQPGPKMPLTRIANSAQDAVSLGFEEVADDIVRFAGNDALCYRADDPESLVRHAAAVSGTRWLTWAGDLLGGRFRADRGDHPYAPQPDQALLDRRIR
jgi:hypothetical protein